MWEMRFSLRTLIVICMALPPFIGLVWWGFFVPADKASPAAAWATVLIVFLILGFFLAPKPPEDYV